MVDAEVNLVVHGKSHRPVRTADGDMYLVLRFIISDVFGALPGFQISRDTGLKLAIKYLAVELATLRSVLAERLADHVAAVGAG